MVCIGKCAPTLPPWGRYRISTVVIDRKSIWGMKKRGEKIGKIKLKFQIKGKIYAKDVKKDRKVV